MFCITLSLISLWTAMSVYWFTTRLGDNREDLWWEHFFALPIFVIAHIIGFLRYRKKK